MNRNLSFAATLQCTLSLLRESKCAKQHLSEAPVMSHRGSQCRRSEQMLFLGEITEQCTRQRPLRTSNQPSNFGQMPALKAGILVTVKQIHYIKRKDKIKIISNREN